MALINRVARLFRADFHAVLDHFEEPELMLRQAIRDMADELQLAEERIAIRVRTQEDLRSRAGKIEESAADSDRQLDLCLRSGNDELARAVVRKKLEAERLLQRLRSKIDENEADIDAERRAADDNREALAGLRQKADLLVARPAPPAANLQDIGWPGLDLRVSDDEVEIAFLHAKETRSAS